MNKNNKNNFIKIKFYNIQGLLTNWQEGVNKPIRKVCNRFKEAITEEQIQKGNCTQLGSLPPTGVDESRGRVREKKSFTSNKPAW